MLLCRYCWGWIASADKSLLKTYLDDIVVASNRWNESDLRFLYSATIAEDIEWRFQHEILPEQVRWEKAISIAETIDVLELDETFDEFPQKLVDRMQALLRPKLILPESRQAALTAIRNSCSWEVAYWKNGLLITATGLMGLDDPSAIEFLFDSLSDDIEYHNESVAFSLARLGSQELKEEFKNRYLGSDYIARLCMMDATERVYAPWAADYCRELIALEAEAELRPWLANALVDQCMWQDIELLRAIVQEDRDDGEHIELHEKLEILTELFQDDFDAINPRLLEIAARKKSIGESSGGLMIESSQCPHCGGYHSGESYDDDEFGDFDDHEAGGALLNGPRKLKCAHMPGPTTIRNVVRVSRNSECPCGSGKKYKKCCMRK